MSGNGLISLDPNLANFPNSLTPACFLKVKKCLKTRLESVLMVFKSCLEFGVGGGGNGREDEGFHPKPRDGPKNVGSWG